MDELVRAGAQKMLQKAIEDKVQQFLSEHAQRVDEQGRRRVVRNGHLRSRELLTGAGPLPTPPAPEDADADRYRGGQMSAELLLRCSDKGPLSARAGVAG